MIKKLPIFVALAVLLVGVAAALLLRGGEDAWICANGQWVRHGSPSAPMPATGCGNAQANGENKEQEDVVITSPAQNQAVSSPLVIEGSARGSWFFEGVMPVKLEDSKGNVLASGQLRALGEWTTENYISFRGELKFVSAKEETGKLVINKDNPSGLPENDGEYRISVLLPAMETMKVKAYFNNSTLDPKNTCTKVFAVERLTQKTQSTARAALEELLAGPTAEEQAKGYATSINPGVKIQSLTVEKGTAKADFDPQLEASVGGSCKVSAIRAQITQTLKQFSTVKNVAISINGRTEDILQP